IVTSSAPTYDPKPATVTEDEEMSKEKEIDKLMALISLSFKKIYKPTNNNLRTSSNTSRANQDNSPRINRGTGYDNQRAVNVAGARENVGTPVVQKSGIQCYNCKEYGHVSRECQKPKRVKDAAYHKEKMLLCKQEEAGVQLNAEQADWKDDTDDESEEQELEAHYMYMAQLQEVQNNNDNYNVFAMENEHPEQPESSHDIYLAEQGDTNITIDSLDICYDRAQDDYDDTDELDQERCYNDNLALMLAPDSDETIRLEKERRSKLSDLIRPFDYDQLNKLYDLFVPQREKSPGQHYFPKTSKMGHTSSNKEFSKESFRKQTTLLGKRMDESIPWDQKTLSNLNWKLKKHSFEHLEKEISKSRNLGKILGVYTDLDEFTNLQCDYVETWEKCEHLEKDLSKSRTMSKSFEALQKHAINLELDLQQCKEKIKNDKSFKENQSNVFLKEREQYFEIQDLESSITRQKLVNLVENKPRTEEDEEIRMNPRCSALLQNHRPHKEQDPRSFILPYSIRKLDFNNALADLGASISIMPLSTYKRLGIRKLEPIDMVIEMADNTKCMPKGIVENLLIKIEKFIFPVDFVILDMVEDLRMPIILGRPLLATAYSKVDIFRKSISLEVGSEKVIFKMRSSFTMTNFESVRSIKSETYLEDDEFKKMIMIYSYTILNPESYEEIVYRITKVEKEKYSIDEANMEQHLGLTPIRKPKVYWCKVILQQKESGHPVTHIATYVMGETRMMIRRNVIGKAQTIRERFRDEDDDNEENLEDSEECGEDKANTIIRVVHDKLNDDWFNGTSEDEDDLEGIIDCLEPKSYNGFINLDDETYNEIKCKLPGITYRKPSPILIEKVEVIRYTIGIKSLQD
ncbi:retrovirus-related pol polyprotein from transposon TNT 1-94, partial [Tanacetum coccineum]